MPRFTIAVERHMDILNAIDRFEDSKRKIRLAADQLKPGLNLFANATLQSEPPDNYADFDINKVRYTAGVNLDLPRRSDCANGTPIARPWSPSNPSCAA